MNVQALWQGLLEFSIPEGRYTVKPALERLQEHGLLVSFVCPFYTEDHKNIVDDLDWSVVQRFAACLGKALGQTEGIIKRYELRATPANISEEAPRLAESLSSNLLSAPDVPALLQKSWRLTEKVARVIRSEAPRNVEIQVLPDIVDIEAALPEIEVLVDPAKAERFARRLAEKYPWQEKGMEQRFRLNYLLYAGTTWVFGGKGYVLLLLESGLFWDLGKFSLFAGRRLPMLRPDPSLRKWRQWQT